MVIVWAKQAEAALRKLHAYIHHESPINAQRVIAEIFATVDKLSDYPEMFPPDKYKKGNDGTWRAFEKYHCRISYRINKNYIRIVRLRHTSRNPAKY